MGYMTEKIALGTYLVNNSVQVVPCLLLSRELQCTFPGDLPEDFVLKNGKDLFASLGVPILTNIFTDRIKNIGDLWDVGNFTVADFKFRFLDR